MTIVADKPQKKQGIPVTSRSRTVPASRLLETVSDEGILSHTQTMPLRRAFQLVQALSKLSSIHVESIDFLPAETGQVAIVTYRRDPDSIEGFRAARMATAHTQVDRMSFYKLELEGGREMVLAVNDDMHGDLSHTLDTVHGECDCDDFRIRCLGKGEKCHHLHAYDMWRADGNTLDCAPVPRSQSETEPGEYVREPFWDDEPMEVKAARRERNARNIKGDF